MEIDTTNRTENMNWKEIRDRTLVDEDFKFEVIGPLIDNFIDNITLDEYKENEITLDDYFDDCKIICQDLYKYCDICINPMQTFWLNKKYSDTRDAIFLSVSQNISCWLILEWLMMNENYVK
jgi:hypothetical protein